MAPELSSLERIRRLYDTFVVEAARLHSVRPEVIAAIIQRESEGGFSRLLDVQGPAGRGDHGHGHGLMQIDDRWHKEFIASGKWKDPRENILYGTFVLADKAKVLKRTRLKVLEAPIELEAATIAAYNCGEGNVLKALRATPPRGVDTYTARGDYSKHVLKMAQDYADLVAAAMLPIRT